VQQKPVQPPAAKKRRRQLDDGGTVSISLGGTTQPQKTPLESIKESQDEQAHTKQESKETEEV